MRRSLEKEMMDLPRNSRQILEEDLANLRTINRTLGAYRGVLRYLRGVTRSGRIRTFSFLDLGTGAGDLPAVVGRWARDEGVKVKIVGLDLDQVTLGVARGQTKDFPEVSLVRADAFSLPFAASTFDFVHASQILHHFSEEQTVTLLKDCTKIARRAILISDLIRHPLAYYGIKVLTKLFSRNEMTRMDAPLSIKRAFTLDEWKKLLSRAGIGAAHVVPVFPYRIFATFSKDFRETV
jgi:2-polyprenyl-3-methyl-5-hydroxy-6-metoxy-1,4-benzoquinol methylase